MPYFPYTKTIAVYTWYLSLRVDAYNCCLWHSYFDPALDQIDWMANQYMTASSCLYLLLNGKFSPPAASLLECLFEKIMYAEQEILWHINPNMILN